MTIFWLNEQLGFTTPFLEISYTKLKILKILREISKSEHNHAIQLRHISNTRKRVMTAATASCTTAQCCPKSYALIASSNPLSLRGGWFPPVS